MLQKPVLERVSPLHVEDQKDFWKNFQVEIFLSHKKYLRIVFHFIVKAS